MYGRANVGEHSSARGGNTVKEPPNIYFADFMRSWAVSVAHCFVWMGTRRTAESVDDGPNVFHECWVDENLALYVRYSHFSRKVGARFARLDIDPTSTRPLDPISRENSSASSVQQASNFYDGGLNGAPPDETEWTDSLGYAWWGDTPSEGWAQAVDNSHRVETILPMRAQVGCAS